METETEKLRRELKASEKARAKLERENENLRRQLGAQGHAAEVLERGPRVGDLALPDDTVDPTEPLDVDVVLDTTKVETSPDLPPELVGEKPDGL